MKRWPEKDRDAWQVVWVLGQDSKPWPIFVRTGGKNAAGESGIRDVTHVEVLEWDPELKQTLNAEDATTYPRVIIGAPREKGGLFSTPIKI